jgi:hypothetical protein
LDFDRTGAGPASACGLGSRKPYDNGISADLSRASLRAPVRDMQEARRSAGFLRSDLVEVTHGTPGCEHGRAVDQE